MTAERLRQIAVEVCLHEMAAEVNAWADAIDPPEPVPVVTDEMVEAVYGALRLRFRGYGPDHRDVLRHTLEAAVKWCGWTPPQELGQEGGPTASSSEAVAPGSQASGEAGVPQGPCTESESLSPPPTSLVTSEKIDCPTCGMSWTQCCEHRSKGLDNCCMACDEVGQRRNHTLQEGDGDDAELDALCTDIALEVVKRERDRWQKDCLVAEANEHGLTERLAMAERLLRRATGTTSIGVRYLALYELTAAEAEYLRSLRDGSDSDE